MKILVLHGPNMNLIGLQQIEQITLQKINSFIKKKLKINSLSAKIVQTNSQSRAINILSQNRNKCSGIIITPESWAYYGYGIRSTLEIIKIPYICINIKNTNQTVFNGALENIYNKNILDSYNQAIQQLKTKIVYNSKK